MKIKKNKKIKKFNIALLRECGNEVFNLNKDELK